MFTRPQTPKWAGKKQKYESIGLKVVDNLVAILRFNFVTYVQDRPC